MYGKNWGPDEECYVCMESTAVHGENIFIIIITIIFFFFLYLAPVP